MRIYSKGKTFLNLRFKDAYLHHYISHTIFRQIELNKHCLR